MFCPESRISMVSPVFLVMVSIAILLTGLLGEVWATLYIEPGDLLVRDDKNTPGNTDDDMIWVRDISRFNNMTYEQQMTAIANLSLSGYTGFRMATNQDMFQLYHNYWHVFSYFVPNYMDNGVEYINGRNDSLAPWTTNTHFTTFTEHFMSGESGWGSSAVADSYASNEYGAWAVLDARPVPEPSIFLLSGLGLAVMVILRHRSSRLQHKKSEKRVVS